MDGLPPPGITAERTFRVERRHTTNLFGTQKHPPGLSAAADADDGDSMRVLGTPQLLAQVEFLGRESLRGTLPDGTGVAGTRAEVRHRRAVSVGRSVLVRTELTDVTDRTLTIEGTLSLADSDRLVGEVVNTLRVVEREPFLDRIDAEDP
jgi:predicted thioesterase